MAKQNAKRKKKQASSGCLVGAALLLLAVLALVVVLLSISSCNRGTEPEPTAYAPGTGAWYRDDLGRIEEDTPLTKGMEAFEKRTRVKPYLTILAGVDPEELTMFAQDQYDALFTDGGHLLVVYDEWGEDGYYLAARSGETSALSQEDVARLLTCLEMAYADPANKTYAEAFGAGFREGAKEVSAVVRAGSGAGLLLGLGLVLILLSAILVFSLRKKARETRREALYLEDEG